MSDGYLVLGGKRLGEALDCISFSLASSLSPPQKIAIVGGGLAGLSTAYHLLQSTITNANDASTLSLTIFDKSLPGKGGASSVAGGYVAIMHVYSSMMIKYLVFFFVN